MASSAHPSFPPRPSYTTGKLPDRSALNPNPLPFGSSAFTRRDRGGEFADNAGGNAGGLGKGVAGHHAQSLPAHSQPQGMQHQPNQPNSNNSPLNELTEEQREEINEAVCAKIKRGPRASFSQKKKKKKKEPKKHSLNWCILLGILTYSSCAW